MKFGVLTFGYNSFSSFNNTLTAKGYYDTNLGDNAQSIAIRNVYRHFGVRDDQMISINRDLLPRYNGEKAVLIMNGVFFKPTFPIPDRITPIFVGFHASEAAITEQVEFLKRHQPIGCRDEWTTSRLKSLGIEAFTTGCLTLTLPKRDQKPKVEKLLIVYGSGAGRLPMAAFKAIPDHLLASADLIYHRLPHVKFPLTATMTDEAEQYEQALFDRYCNDATLVLTPLHHVAAPCMAFGIPVVICREQNDARFSTLETLTPIYTPEQIPQINWNPEPVDIRGVQNSLLQHVRERISPFLR